VGTIDAQKQSHGRVAAAAVAMNHSVREQLFDDQRQAKAIACRDAAIDAERLDEFDRLGQRLQASADEALVSRGHGRCFRAG